MKTVFVKSNVKSGVLLAAFILLAGCSTAPAITEGGQQIQVMEQANAMTASCKKVGPVNVTVNKIWPAQQVYDQAVTDARSKAASLGADAMVLLNSEHGINGLANVITIQAAALKCYNDRSNSP